MGATAPSPGRFQTHVNPEGCTSAGFLITARFFPQVCAGAAAPRPHKLCPEDSGERAGQATRPANFPAAALSFAQAPSAQPPLPPAPQRGRGTGVPPAPFSPAACTRAAVPTEATSAATPRSGFGAWGRKAKLRVPRGVPRGALRRRAGGHLPAHPKGTAVAPRVLGGGRWSPCPGTRGAATAAGVASAIKPEQRRGRRGPAGDGTPRPGHSHSGEGH